MRAILSNLLWGKKIGFNITNNKIVVYNSGLGLVWTGSWGDHMRCTVSGARGIILWHVADKTPPLFKRPISTIEGAVTKGSATVYINSSSACSPVALLCAACCCCYCCCLGDGAADERSARGGSGGAQIRRRCSSEIRPGQRRGFPLQPTQIHRRSGTWTAATAGAEFVPLVPSVPSHACPASVNEILSSLFFARLPPPPLLFYFCSFGMGSPIRRSFWRPWGKGDRERWLSGMCWGRSRPVRYCSRLMLLKGNSR